MSGVCDMDAPTQSQKRGTKWRRGRCLCGSGTAAEQQLTAAAPAQPRTSQPCWSNFEARLRGLRSQHSNTLRARASRFTLPLRLAAAAHCRLLCTCQFCLSPVNSFELALSMGSQVPFQEFLLYEISLNRIPDESSSLSNTYETVRETSMQLWLLTPIFSLPLKRGPSRHDVVRTGEIFKHNFISTRLTPWHHVQHRPS